MRITNSHRGHHTNLTKCSKMTEGEHKIHGMNGVTDSGGAASKDESPQNAETYSLGGRLKFFKNGKFILELARAREGEKVAWVPVPKKTFWPPQGSASSVSTYRQESSASLSVSDDNSSVQSSPWQRDHTWKQTTPQRNTSTHLNFYYRGLRASKRPDSQRIATGCWLHRLRRNPHATNNSERTKCVSTNTKCNRCVNKCAISASRPVARPPLAQIVHVLWNKSLQALNSITSPRKRILRELERVTIDDLSYKRCRGKVNQHPAASSPRQDAVVVTDVNGSGVEEQRPTGTVATTATAVVATTASKNCSYSITSLLGGKLDGREEKLSSQFVPRSVASHARDEVYGSDTVDGPAIRATEFTMNKRSSMSVPSPVLPSSTADHYHAQAQSQYGTHHGAPFMAPYAVYSSLSHHHGYAPSYYSAVYSRGAHAFYHAALAHPAATAAAAAAVAAANATAPPPSISRHDHQPPYTWTLPATYEHNPIHRDDTISDVPLNLSKHAD